MKHPRITIIVLNYNGIRDTRECIKSLLKTSYKNRQIVVVDNGSVINEARVLKKEFKNRSLTFVRFNTNHGFSGGNNIIMKKVRTPYIALVNNDVVVESGWLTPIIKLLENDARIAVVQPKILWAYNRHYFDYAGAAGGFIDFLGYPFTRGRIFTTLEPDRGQYDKRTEIFWASGATMVMRKKVLEEGGYFDEAFFNYMEEIDLCYRILRTGYNIVYEPVSVVFHKVASTAGNNSFRKRYLEHRNNLLLVLKNFPMVQLVYILPMRFFMELLSIIYYICIGRADFALAATKSFGSFLILSPGYLYRRLKGRRLNFTLVDRLIYPRSIVFDYFILKKKTFEKIMNLDQSKI